MRSLRGTCFYLNQLYSFRFSQNGWRLEERSTGRRHSKKSTVSEKKGLWPDFKKPLPTLPRESKEHPVRMRKCRKRNSRSCRSRGSRIRSFVTCRFGTSIQAEYLKHPANLFTERRRDARLQMHPHIDVGI